MSYTPLPDLSVGDDISPSNWTAWIDGNFESGPTALVSARGDMFPASGHQSAVVFPRGTDYQIIESDDSTPSGLKHSWAYVPVGGIIMWSGSLGSLPFNWILCDGTGGTPDLRDQFIVGAGGSYSVGASGGPTDVSHAHAVSASFAAGGSHTHTQAATNNESSHSHGGVTAGANQVVQVVSGSIEGVATAVHTHTFSTLNVTHNHANPTTDAATHTHTASVGTGLTSPDVRPPYYALAYIMRTV